MSKGVPASQTGGVPAFAIGGRMVQQRERLLSMTEEERRWRAQYLKDQFLAPDEPRYSHEYYVATNNIFRRLGKVPLDFLFKPLVPLLPKNTYKKYRFLTGRLLMGLGLAYVAAYYLKYNTDKWTGESEFLWGTCRPQLVPGDPDYPHVPVKQPYEYYDSGFSKSIFFKGPPPSQ